MKAAIDAVPYSPSVKVGLQFKRRFWEEDEAIYGGISYTDLPIRQIAYPNSGFNRSRQRRAARRLSFRRAPTPTSSPSMPPAERVARAVEFGASIHPQYQRRVRERHRGRLASRAVHAGLRRQLDRKGEGGALRQSLPDRRPDRAGGRARVLPSGLAGGRDPVVARRHHAAARSRGQNVMQHRRCSANSR